MVDLARDSSLEDILASIKRIIAEDGAAAPPPIRRVPSYASEAIRAVELPDPVEPHEDTLDAELPVANPDDVASVEERTLSGVAPDTTMPSAETAAPDGSAAPLVSDHVASASRQSLAALSAMIVTSPGAQDGRLDALVREMLRPMLRDWLDARLPALVEELVAKEIARITGLNG